MVATYTLLRPLHRAVTFITIEKWQALKIQWVGDCFPKLGQSGNIGLEVHTLPYTEVAGGYQYALRGSGQEYRPRLIIKTSNGRIILSWQTAEGRYHNRQPSSSAALAVTQPQPTIVKESSQVKSGHRVSGLTYTGDASTLWNKTWLQASITRIWPPHVKKRDELVIWLLGAICCHVHVVESLRLRPGDSHS